MSDNECNPHPNAPHGYDRNASHNEDRYVCVCEHWQPPASGRLNLKDDGAVNYPKVNSSINAGSIFAATPPYNISLVPRGPGSVILSFPGGKQIRFRPADDGRITAEYDPADLTEAAQAFITAVERMLHK